MDTQSKKSFFKRFWWLFLIIIILISSAIFLFIYRDNNKEVNLHNSQLVNSANETDNIIKSIGINLDYYDPATNKAGDFLFTKISLPQDRLFLDYGYIIPAEETADKIEASNPHPTFYLPLGTKVLAPIDGIVVEVPELYSHDYSVQITPDGTMAGLIFELEHIKNPLVKAGDRVTAGQVVAEVTDFSSHNYPGFGSFDLAVFHTNESGQPEHLCPFLYLDPSVRDEIEAKILDFYKKWEIYIGDVSLYDETTYQTPGCLTTDPIEG